MTGDKPFYRVNPLVAIMKLAYSAATTSGYSASYLYRRKGNTTPTTTREATGNVLLKHYLKTNTGVSSVLFLWAAAFCAALVLTSCDEDNGKLADGTCIFINGKDKTNKAASISAKTVKEICLGDSLLLIRHDLTI